MEQITNETKQRIIKEKLQIWHQNLYSLELDAKVAKKAADDRMLENVKQQLKKALIALDLLKAELEELENAVQDQ